MILPAFLWPKHDAPREGYHPAGLQHVLDAIAAINEERAQFGLPPLTFTPPTPEQDPRE